MAKLRHLAISTYQPDRLAHFYKTVFGLEELYRTQRGSIHLSDGDVNLAILNANDPKDGERKAGLYHFGFQVDDIEAAAERIRELHPEGAPERREATYAEWRATDPDGNIFDLSERGFGGGPRPRREGKDQL